MPDFSLIQTVLSNDLTTLKDYCEKNVQKHFENRVASKKLEILAKENNVTVEKMAEMMEVSTKDSK
jgi:hypothetical protein